jgi:hypothetical protein
MLVALLASSIANADFQRGVVVAVDEKTFTIKYPGCDKFTFAYDPDMGKPEIRKQPGGWVGLHHPLGVTPDKIKVGMFVEVFHTNVKGVLVCKRALPIVEHLGTREIDFSPLLAKGKDKLPEFVLRIHIQTREGLGSFFPHTYEFQFDEGASIKDVRAIVMGILSPRGNRDSKLLVGLRTQGALDRGWKVKEAGDSKLLIEAHHKDGKDQPVNAVEVEVKKFPKERQPRVRRIDPRDPTKSLESDDVEHRTSETKDRP